MSLKRDKRKVWEEFFYRIVEILRRADDVRPPFIVLGELRAGFAAGSDHICDRQSDWAKPSFFSQSLAR
ncbi:MAG: hypothetical protein AAB268_07005 [Elusimicrobiota bacterium]|mgnify:CR=1 FL=1